jgi:hypothetical protein
MSDKDTVREALWDAIHWQESLADAVKHLTDGSYEEAVKQAKKYRSLLKRRYAETKTQVDIALEGAELVGLDALRAMLPNHRRRS